MERTRILTLIAGMVAALALWLAPGGAYAQDGVQKGVQSGAQNSAQAQSPPSFASTCHAATGSDVSFEDMVLALDKGAQTSAGWTCDNSDWRADEPAAWVLFDKAEWAGEEVPRFFFSRIARFETITFAALDDDGTMRFARFTEAQGDPFAAGPVFQLELPEVTAETRAVIMRVQRPHSVPLLTEARLAHLPEDADWSQIDMMLLALVIGMLVLPLFFDISFFIVLRERFVALHAVMVVSMITYVMFAGGLISVFADVPLRVIAVAGPLAWAVGCGLSALFLADFLEDRAQSLFMQRLTIGAGIWTIIVPGFFALQLHTTQPLDDRAYFLTFVPAITVITAAIVEAIWRGSRSARFIAAAWTPIMFASLDRMLRGLGVYVGPSHLDQALYVATGIEVMMISLAIADRFLALRRERDAAVTEARMMEQLSERDPLTSLMNRRAVEARFADLRSQGFDTFAVIDLDQFKQINDQFGHQIGDRALVACGEALQSGGGGRDRDIIAVRLGGDEFVLLLRGRRSIERAEALRQAIPLRIAADVPGLDRPVTASMGVIELPRAAGQFMTFHDLYARADQLLYEAKASGRNRMYFERLELFSEAPPARPPARPDARPPARPDAQGEHRQDIAA